MEGRDVLQDCIPDMGELELAYVSIEELTINLFHYGFLDGPGNAMCLLTHNRKTVHIDTVS